MMSGIAGCLDELSGLIDQLISEREELRREAGVMRELRREAETSLMEIYMREVLSVYGLRDAAILASKLFAVL